MIWPTLIVLFLWSVCFGGTIAKDDDLKKKPWISLLGYVATMLFVFATWWAGYVWGGK
jgi:hypothetical protein